MNPSPLRYPGGKYKVYKLIKELVEINKCSTYIEPFAGGSAISLQLLYDEVVKKVVINDYDYSIFELWQSILYRSDELIELIRKTPVTLDEWHKQKQTRESYENYDPIYLAFSTLFLNRTNRSGIIDKAGPIGGLEQNGTYKIDCRFNKEVIINKIEKISSYKDKITCTNLEAINFIEEEIPKTKKSFTFFDPPYYKKGKSLYTNFYNHGDHENLAKAISRNLKNRKWIVTYDPADEIRQMYSNRLSIDLSLNYSVQTKKVGKEIMFFSNKTKQTIN